MTKRRIQPILAGLLALGATASVLAETDSELLERIRPVGGVTVATPAPKAAPASETAPAPKAAPVAEAAPSPKAETAAPAAPAPAPKAETTTPAAPAAAPAAPAAGDGAALFAAKACNTCHGADGKTPIMPTYPKIAGQNKEYLLEQIKDIKSGARSNAQAAVMKGIVANVGDADLERIADWLSSQPSH